MNLKNWIVLFAGIMVFTIKAYSQSGSDFFVVGSDTTFCEKLSYRQSGDRRIIEITYTDAKGKVQLNGKKNLPDVSSFHINGADFDKNPFMPDQGGENYRYDKRYVDGKLMVYLDSNFWFDTTVVYSPILKRDVQSIQQYGPTGQYRFLIKMPNGKYYKANSKKDCSEFIEPFLYQCPAFASTFKGSLDKMENFAQPRMFVWDKTWGTITKDEQNFMQAIVLYNSICE
jgi:hypothetical protein